jgi:hypothetical protein
VVQPELEIAAEVPIERARQPGELQDGVLQGMEQDGTQQLVEPGIPLLHGHEAPLHHPVAHPRALAVGQQLVEGRHVEHAAPDEEVAELLAHGVAAQVPQIPTSPIEPTGPVVLLQHKLPPGALLVEGAHEGGKEMAEADFGHSLSGIWI